MKFIFAAALMIPSLGTSPGIAENGIEMQHGRDGIRLAASSSKLTKVPPEVTSAARFYVDECTSYGAEPSPTDRFVSKVELNEDNKPDYIIDTGELNASCFCGSGGCTIEAWVSGRGGYVKAYESNVRGWQLSPKGKLPPVLIVDLHGTACGGVGVDLCLKALLYQEGKLIDTTAGR